MLTNLQICIPQHFTGQNLPTLFLPNYDAAEKFYDFFTSHLSNPGTRRVYSNCVNAFSTWCRDRGIEQLDRVRSIHVAGFIEQLQKTHEKPTVKLHLSAIRALFDWLVVKQVIEMNPAHAVRGPKLVVAKGKTPPINADDARTLLASIETNTRVDGGAGVTNKTLLRGSQLFLKSQRLWERSLEW